MHTCMKYASAYSSCDTLVRVCMCTGMSVTICICICIWIYKTLVSCYLLCICILRGTGRV